MSKRSKLSPELREALKQLEAQGPQWHYSPELRARLWAITKRHNSHLQAKANKANQEEAEYRRMLENPI